MITYADIQSIEGSQGHFKVKVRKRARSVDLERCTGGGIAGMQAALDMANSGYFVYLVEESPSIGGKMAQIDKTFPTNDCAM